jgi:hypothetical protein
LMSVGQNLWQWFFNNFHIIMTTEDTTEKIKFPSGPFFSTYGTTLYHVDAVYRPRNKKC